MANYIEREAAIKLIAEDKVEITPLLCAITQAYTAEQAFDGLNQSCDRHIKFINSIPSADVQPVKHGRWISIGHKLSRICSVCNCDEPYKFADDDANVYDYCPNCGAKMDGET